MQRRRKASSFEHEAAGQGPDDPGHGLGRRQIADRRRALPRLHQARPFGRAVQAAEHVEQCRRHARTAARSAAPRRCRPAPAASRRSVDMNPVLLKPQSEIGAQVVLQGRVVRQRQGARISDAEAEAAAGRCSRASRRLESRGRSRPGRRRGQRRGDQSARRRHRQYGVCARRRRAGRADRRHRPRRRDRADRRHQGRARRRPTPR